ncbi:MAG: hypothetical protein IJZ92_05545 [Bacteroidaceae bacterium]|nr:hypothetical protein [Bacteroidaceae bacterium]
MKTALKIPRWTHLFVWLITALLFLAFESGELPTLYFQPDVEQAYALQVVAVVLTLLGSYVSMRLMAFSSVKQSVQRQEEVSALRTYSTLCLVRTLLVAIAIWYNLLVYYLADFSSTFFYCFLITIVASLFCWPSQATFESMRAPQSQEPKNQA